MPPTDKMTTYQVTLPARVPYEDEHYRWDYDDCGVICRYDKETEEWEPMEEHCVECGYRPDECHCEEEDGSIADEEDVPTFPVSAAVPDHPEDGMRAVDVDGEAWVYSKKDDEWTRE